MSRTRKLSRADVIPVCPTGTSHLKGLELSLRAWNELEKSGKKTYLFYPASSKLSTVASNFVLEGERLELHKRYKCSVRTPWWQVPLVGTPDLFITYMNHHCVRMIENKASLHILNSHYGFTLFRGRKTLGRELLPIASMNSLTLLGGELEGRAFGGGLLKLEPRDVEKIFIPSHGVIAEAAEQLANLSPRIAAPLRKNDFDSVIQLVDDILLSKVMRFTPSDLKDIRQARKALFGRRLARNRRGNEVTNPHTGSAPRTRSEAG